jgi:hypothetical protein
MFIKIKQGVFKQGTTRIATENPLVGGSIQPIIVQMAWTASLNSRQVYLK